MLNVRPVIYVIGLVACLMSVLLLVPLIIDISLGNHDWQNFAASSLTVGFAGIAMMIATYEKGVLHLNLKQAFLLTALGWLAMSFLSAIPFIGLGISYTDSFFEAVSGITTTGSTVLAGLDTLPPGILLWRALLQWIGGIGIIVMAILILPFLRVGGMQLFKIESSETSEKVDPFAYETVKKIIIVYVFITAACVAVYYQLGMSAFDALCHAMATISTGGYSTHDASMGYFKDFRMYWAGIVFMIAGAVPFYLYIKAARGQFRSIFRDSQVRGLLYFLFGISLLIAFWLMEKRSLDFGSAFTLTAFHVTSIVTTTGFATEDYTFWGTGAFGMFLILTFVGGCSGSTAGGIKIYRFQVLIEIVRVHVKHLFSPNRVAIGRYNGKKLPDDVPFSVLAFLAVYVATIALATVILTLLGLDLLTAYSAVVTAIGNVGPGLGEIVGPAGNFQSLPDAAKWLLSVTMLLGRLEIFALLVMFDPDFWRG